MTGSYEHPSLTMRVTPEQRDRAEDYLQQAYADGRITEDDFDRRIGQVIGSETRRDLNEAFYGLVQTPGMAMSPYASTPGYGASAYVPARADAEPSGRATAAIAHFSVFFSWLLGPGLIFAMSQKGSYARKEAAKAFNSQLIFFLIFMAVGMIRGLTGAEFLDPVFPILIVTGIVLTIIGGAKAGQGEDWKNPVKKVIKLEVLPEK